MLLFGKCKSNEKYTSASVSLSANTSNAQDIKNCNDFLNQNACDPTDPSSCDGPVYYCPNQGGFVAQDPSQFTPCNTKSVAFTPDQCSNPIRFPYSDPSGYLLDNESQCVGGSNPVTCPLIDPITGYTGFCSPTGSC